MARHNQFRSLLLFKENIEFKASLLESRVDAKLLRSLDPTPADVFEEAAKVEGATQQNLMFFLKLLKDLRTPKGNQSLVTEDGLDYLANVLWQVSWKSTSSAARAQRPSATTSDQEGQPRTPDNIALQLQEKRLAQENAAAAQQAKRKLQPTHSIAPERPAAKRAAGEGSGRGQNAVPLSPVARATAAQGGTRRATPPPNPPQTTAQPSPSRRLPPTSSTPTLNHNPADPSRTVRRNTSNPERSRRRTGDMAAAAAAVPPEITLGTMRTLSEGSLPRDETTKEMNDLPLVKALMELQTATTKKECEQVKMAILQYYKSPSMPKLTRAIADIARGNEKAEKAALKLKVALPSALRSDFESQLQMFLSASVAGVSPKAEAPQPLAVAPLSPARTMSPPPSPLAALAAAAAAAAEAAAAAVPSTTAVPISPRATNNRASPAPVISAGAAGTSGSGGPAHTSSDPRPLSRNASPTPPQRRDGRNTPKSHYQAPSLAEVCAAVDGIAQLQVAAQGPHVDLAAAVAGARPPSPPPAPPPTMVGSHAVKDKLYSAHSRGSAGALLASVPSNPMSIEGMPGGPTVPVVDMPPAGELVIKIEPGRPDVDADIKPPATH